LKGFRVAPIYTLLQRGVIKLPFSLTSELAETTRLIRRYRDVLISLADACLIRMAELDEDAVVFTTDSMGDR
jgi:uncharacterized protein